MLTLESPSFLLLLFLIPIAVYLRHFWKNRGGKLTFSFKLWEGNGFTPNRGGTQFVLFFSALFFWIGITCLIIAIAGPIETVREKYFLNRGSDIIIVLDESPSMAALDFAPNNRFETAKEVIREFISNRDNDFIGLVGFSKEAAIRVPPTNDYKALLKRLDDIKLLTLGDGTAIGMGLAVGVLHLKESKAKERSIILLTDGTNNAGEIQPLTAAEIAGQLGITIYTIGIGTEGEVPMRIVDPETGEEKRGVYSGGIDEDILQEIAGKTGGAFFHVDRPGILTSAFKAIDSLESVEKQIEYKVVSLPRQDSFIIAAMVLILLDFLIRKWLLREII